MMIKVLFAFTFLFSYPAFSSLTVSECTFQKKSIPKTIAEAIKKYNFIVVGTVDPSGFTETHKNFRSARLNVKTVWQGKVDSSYQIREDKCTSLTPGATYLIFARMGGYETLNNFGEIIPVDQATSTLSELGEGWPTDPTIKSSYPNTDERLKCPEGMIYKRYLAFDKTRTYSCENPNDLNAPKPMLAIYDNGKIKEQGTLKNHAPIGEWKYYDREGNLKATKQFDQNGNEVCNETKQVPEGHTVIGYLKNKSLYPFMVWDGSQLKPIGEQGIKNIKSFTPIDKKEPVVFTHSSPHRDAHSNVCIYSGSIAFDAADLILVSSKKFDFILPIPQAAKDQFNALRGPCVRHGDYVPEKCLYKELLAVTDINKNGRYEFWFKQPYLWDIGIAIGEVSEDKKSLKVIASDCSDCSD